MSVEFRKLLGAALFGTSVCCAAPAMAITVDPCKYIAGDGVTITECSNGTYGSSNYYGSYSLSNQSEFDIYKFFVSTQASDKTSQSSWTSRENWVSAYYSEDCRRRPQTGAKLTT